MFFSWKFSQFSAVTFFLYLVDKWPPPKKDILRLTLIQQVLFVVSHVKTVLKTLSLSISLRAWTMIEEIIFFIPI